MHFGEFVNQLRKSAHLSSAELGNMVGCSSSFISGIERGAQFPSTMMAGNILFALNVEYKELNPLTLELNDGTIFEFKSSLRGRNRETMVEVKMEPGLTNEQIIRIEALNAAIKFHETTDIFSIEETKHMKDQVIRTANRFVDYITTGENTHA